MGELSVTIKYGKGFEETWAVFRSEKPAEIRALIVDYFGLQMDAVDMPLHDLVIDVTNIAHGVSAASRGLGGSVIKASNKPNPWDEAQQPQEEVNPIRVLINNCSTVDALYSIWADHQNEINPDPELLAAWKAKGKSLQEAS